MNAPKPVAISFLNNGIAASLGTEFEIVECINLLSNMIDRLEQIEINLMDAI